MEAQDLLTPRAMTEADTEWQTGVPAGFNAYWDDERKLAYYHNVAGLLHTRAARPLRKAATLKHSPATLATQRCDSLSFSKNTFVLCVS